VSASDRNAGFFVVRCYYVLVSLDELSQFPVTGRFLLGRCRDALEDTGKASLEEIFSRQSVHASGEVVARAYAQTSQVTILVEGFVIRSISEGDMIDLASLVLGHLDHDLIALGPVRMAHTDHDQLRQLALHDRHVGQGLWIASQLDSAIQRQWTVKLGRLKAARRLARVLSELWCRLELVGLARHDGFEVPMTQLDLADMCGTTAIHMNRALGELRRLGLADFRRGLVSSPDREALAHYGAFRPDYLVAGPAQSIM
jgi:CRP-like cAMP-binding protein